MYKVNKLLEKELYNNTIDDSGISDFLSNVNVIIFKIQWLAFSKDWTSKVNDRA